MYCGWDVTPLVQLKTMAIRVIRTSTIGCGFICQNGNLIMAIAFFTVYRVYNWEFNSRKQIKVILPTWDGPFLNLLIYNMNIAKKCTKIHVLGKIAFFG